MDRFEKGAVIAEVVDRMRAANSWTGETHLQKALYVLQELGGVDLEVNFTLWKHGPFSFDLRDDLTTLLSDGVIEEDPSPPYGPRLSTTEAGERLKTRYEGVVARYRSPVELVAKSLGSKNVFQLEQLSTALYVSREGYADPDEMVARIRELKPHITPEAARAAVVELRQLEQDVSHVTPV